MIFPQQFRTAQFSAFSTFLHCSAL